jgi:hypothetical protein
MYFFMYFFACPKKYQKKTPENDDSPFSGRFPDWAFALLWLKAFRTLLNRQLTAFTQPTIRHQRDTTWHYSSTEV